MVRVQQGALSRTESGLSDDRKIIHTGPSPRGWHRLQLAAECLQKYAWNYGTGNPNGGKRLKVDSKRPALAVGTLVHLALAQHYAEMRDGPEGGWETPHRAVELISKLEGVEKHAERALIAFDAYRLKYDWRDKEQWKVLAVEELLSTQIAGKYLLTGRADLVIEDPGGRVFVVDHKTTGRIQKSHKEFYPISGQLLGYSHMAREKYGERFAGLIVNLIQTDGQRFERFTIPRSPHLESKFEQSVVDIEESIERMKASGRAQDDWPKAMSELVCYHRYGACDFIDKCRWGQEAKKGGAWSFALN